MRNPATRSLNSEIHLDEAKVGPYLTPLANVPVSGCECEAGNTARCNTVCEDTKGLMDELFLSEKWQEKNDKEKKSTFDNLGKLNQNLRVSKREANKRIIRKTRARHILHIVKCYMYPILFYGVEACTLNKTV